MDFNLHQSICAANYAVGQLMSVEFDATHRMDQEAGIRSARKHLMDALDALSSYQAKLPEKKVAA